MQGDVCGVPGHQELDIPAVVLGFYALWPLKGNSLQSPKATGQCRCTLHCSSQQAQRKTTFGPVGAVKLIAYYLFR